MSKLVILLSAILMSVTVYGQTTADILVLYGQTKEYPRKNKIGDVDLLIHQDGEDFDAMMTNEEGTYELLLDLGHEYRFWFEKEGYFPKHFIIDTTDLSDEQQKGGFTFEVDMTLIPRYEGLDLPLSEDPVSIASYVPSLDMIMFDRDMAAAYSAQIEEIMSRKKYKKKKK